MSPADAKREDEEVMTYLKEKRPGVKAASLWGGSAGDAKTQAKKYAQYKESEKKKPASSKSVGRK